MKELICNSVYFGVTISLLGYGLGLAVKRKYNHGFINPLLISILFVLAVLLLFEIDYDSYNQGAQYLSYLLTPATVCLAIPLYKQLELLKKHLKAILAGIASGVLTSLGSVLALSYLFNLTHTQYVTLLPKSITTAIGLGVAQELGGLTTIAVAVIIVTGVIGNVTAEAVCKLLNIKDPLAVGLAIGTSSHAMGTAKALEIGEVEGAMSGLSIVVAGILTVILAPLFALLL